MIINIYKNIKISKYIEMVDKMDFDLLNTDIPLTKINLPNPWVVYLYDKQVFKKMVSNKQNSQNKPNKEIYTLNTLNDLIYFFKLMEIKENDRLNLDANDYIIMRKGIEPIWEDPKNVDGGTFTLKVSHSKGYDIWEMFTMYMIGETLTKEMDKINGITVSYIPNSFQNSQNNESYTYIKIWDGAKDRTRDEFVSILPNDLLTKIRSESLLYSQNSKKKDFNEKDIMSKIKNRGGNRNERGGFINKKRY